MDHYKQDDRNTGCIHSYYYFIRHLHLHSETEEAEQRHYEKETQISQTNGSREDKHVEQKGKVKNRTETKGKHNTVITTQTVN